MAVNTILLDFTIDRLTMKSDKQLNLVCRSIEECLRDFLINLKHVSSFKFEEVYVGLYTAEPGATVHLKMYQNGLITVNIDYFKGEKQKPILPYERCKELERDILDRVVNIRKCQSLPPIKRGTFMRYYITSDERLLEYDIDKMLFEEITPYQKVQIAHSKSLGNMLILDDLQNIAESDFIYTETLMAKGKECYTDKEIVILGGGDGALLHELLKENPKEVIMLEIDEVVIKACSKYLRSLCGDVLDKKSGENYQILIGDCIKSLEHFIKENRKFDYIFGDLTDIPISENLSGQLWAFLDQILQISFKLLKADGKFMTHLSGATSIESMETYKSLLYKIEPPVTLTTSKAFIPSFMEEWLFCQVFYK